MANYLVSTINNKPKSILYLSGNLDVDYLRCLTLHGLKTVYGTMCHDYPKIKHLYTDFDYSYPLYGKGFTYSKLLSPDTHSHDYDNNIVDLIRSHYFDIVIYGSYHRGLPLIDLVTQFYTPDKIVFMCGEDLHSKCYDKLIANGHNVFIREL
jgi:hypothetical protein